MPILLDLLDLSIGDDQASLLFLGRDCSLLDEEPPLEVILSDGSPDPLDMRHVPCSRDRLHVLDVCDVIGELIIRGGNEVVMEALEFLLLL